MNLDFFAAQPSTESQRIDIQQGDLQLFPQLFSQQESDHYLALLKNNIAWQSETIIMFGKEITVPRLVAWYGDVGTTYTYSNIEHTPLHWTDTLIDIKQRVEAVSGILFNSVLLNLYRDGNDSMGWHSDDEPALAKNPAIASVSFGARRTFQMRHKQDKTQKMAIPLGHGTGLLMAGETQHYWQHQIPKSKTVRGERINLTFRQIKQIRD